MTSEERKEARYQRRKAKRREKSRQYGAKSFDEVMSFGNLCKSGKTCCNGSRWKTSTILFENNLLSCCCDIRDSLVDGTRKFKGFQSFTTIEHGKARNIDALPIKERAAQKCLCNAFTSMLGGYGNVCKTSFGGTGALCLEILSRSYGLRTASGRQVNNAAHYKN